MTDSTTHGERTPRPELGPLRPERIIFREGTSDVDIYWLLTSLVVPRPIAWVGTCSADGVGNLAPHSFFNVACGRPPIVMFSSTGLKDTVRNVGQTREFVVNVVSEQLTDLVNDSSAPFPPSVDEAEHLGIALEPSELVAIPRVTDSPASIECRLHSLIEVGEATLVLGHVVAITVHADVLTRDQRPDIGRLRPMSRLGGSEWGLPPSPIVVKRPMDSLDVARRSGGSRGRP